MNKNLIILVIGLIMARVAFANPPILQKVDIPDLDKSLFKGYFLNDDQVFKITSGALKNKTILFTTVDPVNSDQSRLPQFVVLDNNTIVDQQNLPTLEEGWNLVAVDAVAALSQADANSDIRILAILTLEPLSGRSQDYWQQPFVLDISSNGKINTNTRLNHDLAKRFHSIKTIKSLKEYLKNRGE